jgi:hypothetical protein
MIKFNFKLKELKDICPWGSKETGYSLSWFGLTDAFYWISIDKYELFRYTEDYLEQIELKETLPYVDYQFARILWDFLEILPDIAVSVPDEIYERISSINGLLRYEKTLNYWLNEIWNEEDEEYDEKYIPASSWLYERMLGSGHLLNAPSIFFIRNKNKITVYWFCDYKNDEKTQVWSETQGHFTMDFSEFIDNISKSFNYFFSEMEEQVEEACVSWPFDDVHIDFELLKESQIKFRNDMTQTISLIKNSLIKDDTHWENICKSVTNIVQEVDGHR